jgi:hypothetical protein
VLHRHFADFDAFLAALVTAHVVETERRGELLRAAAGTGTVLENLTQALIEVFSSVTVALIGLVMARDELRARLREQTGTTRGLPLAQETAAMVHGYLEAERGLGRIARDADVGTLAPTLVGAAHLRFADREADPARVEDVRRFVRAVVGGVLTG